MGHRYEEAVLQLLGRHGGTLERRARSTDGTTEVHLIRLRSLDRQHAFMIGPDRAGK
jgi:hypothetical protein